MQDFIVYIVVLVFWGGRKVDYKNLKKSKNRKIHMCKDICTYLFLFTICNIPKDYWRNCKVRSSVCITFEQLVRNSTNVNKSGFLKESLNVIYCLSFVDIGTPKIPKM